MTELTSQDFSSEAFVMNMAVPCHFVVAMASGDNEERTNERTASFTRALIKTHRSRWWRGVPRW